MTDKQIIIYKKECYNEPYCSLNQVLEQLKRKEQECEELKNFHINLVGVKECEIRELVKYKQALTEIKELLLKTPTDSKEYCLNAKSVILQKCEVLDVR